MSGERRVPFQAPVDYSIIEIDSEMTTNLTNCLSLVSGDISKFPSDYPVSRAVFSVRREKGGESSLRRRRVKYEVTHHHREQIRCLASCRVAAGLIRLPPSGEVCSIARVQLPFVLSQSRSSHVGHVYNALPAGGSPRNPIQVTRIRGATTSLPGFLFPTAAHRAAPECRSSFHRSGGSTSEGCNPRH